MEDDVTRRFERLEDRTAALENREAGRDVEVRLNTTAMNRLSVLVGSAGVGILGAVLTFLLTGR